MAQSKTERERRRVERELKKIAYANAADYVEILENPQEGRLVKTVATAKLGGGRLSALAAVKEGKNGVEIKLKDSLKALELLCKLNGLLSPEKKDNGGQNSLEELLEGLRELENSPTEDEEEEDDL